MNLNNFFIPNSNDFDESIFDGSTLILPIVSLGNVPQLTVDLFINGNLLGPLKKVGLLDPSYHIPVVGAIDHLPFKNLNSSNQFLNQITTPIEVYQTSNKLYTFIQQRSPIIKARKDEWIEEFKKWIKRIKFTSILILVSIDAGTRKDTQLKNPSRIYYYYQNNNNNTIPSNKSTSSNTEIRKKIQQRYPNFINNNNEEENLLNNNRNNSPVFSAGGLATRLISSLTSSSSSDSIINNSEINTLIIYVAEGDNRTLAKSFSLELYSLLDPNHSVVSVNDLVEPISWIASDSYQDKTRADLFG